MRLFKQFFQVFPPVWGLIACSLWLNQYRVIAWTKALPLQTDKFPYDAFYVVPLDGKFGNFGGNHNREPKTIGSRQKSNSKQWVKKNPPPSENFLDIRGFCKAVLFW